MGTTRSRLVGTAVAVLLTALACGGDDDEGDGGASTGVDPTTTSTTLPAAPADLPGRLMFSRFDESTHTFESTHVANADGSDEQELPLPGPEGGGRWSHGGEHIAVMTITDDDRVGTAIISPDGTLERVLTLPDPTINLVCTVWSPDDSRLSCEGWDDSDASRRGIYEVDASDGGNMKRLTTPGGAKVDLPGDYSPDGGQLVFVQRPNESEEPGPVMSLDLASSQVRTVGSKTVDDPPRFSPDGTSLLTSSRGKIVAMDLEGAVEHEIQDDDAFLFGAVWSPDGEWIAFSRTTSESRADIFISGPDGEDRAQVTDTSENEILVEWGAVPQ